MFILVPMRNLRQYLIPGLFFGLIGLLPAIDANVAFARFLSPNGAYLEIHTHIAGTTVGWTPQPGPDSLLVATVDVTVLLSRGDSLLVADRFRLTSPASRSVTDFVDLRRYAVETGLEYELELIIADAADPERIKKYKTAVAMPAWPEQAAQSDLVLLAGVEPENGPANTFTRHGLQMEPLPHGYYGPNFSVLSFYNEVYATDRSAGERVLLLAKIEREANGTFKTTQAVSKVKPTADLIPFVQRMDISKLPSGRYLLALEIRDENNQLLSRREVPFYRSNPQLDARQREELLANTDVEDTFLGKMDFDSLKYATLAIVPLMPQKEVPATNLMIRKKDAEALRMFLYSFWARESPGDPEGGYRKYMEVADGVHKEFYSGFRFGFETDRGYMWLKYGPPNDLTRVETDPSAPPYEIWSYNFVERTGQHNRRFVFYNPSLAHNDFELLHSDIIGERNNPNWESLLYQDSQSVDEFGDGSRGMGRNAGQIFSDF